MVVILLAAIKLEIKNQDNSLLLKGYPLMLRLDVIKRNGPVLFDVNKMLCEDCLVFEECGCMRGQIGNRGINLFS